MEHWASRLGQSSHQAEDTARVELSTSAVIILQHENTWHRTPALPVFVPGLLLRVADNLEVDRLMCLSAEDEASVVPGTQQNHPSPDRVAGQGDRGSKGTRQVPITSPYHVEEPGYIWTTPGYLRVLFVATRVEATVCRCTAVNERSHLSVEFLVLQIRRQRRGGGRSGCGGGDAM